MALATATLQVVLQAGDEMALVPLPFRLEEPPNVDGADQPFTVFHASASPSEDRGFIALPQGANPEDFELSLSDVSIPLTSNGRASSGQAIFVGFRDAFAQATRTFPSMQLAALDSLTVTSSLIEGVDPPAASGPGPTYTITLDPARGTPSNFLLLVKETPTSDLLLGILALVVLLPVGFAGGLMIPTVKPTIIRWVCLVVLVADSFAMASAVSERGWLDGVTLAFESSFGGVLGFSFKTFRAAASLRRQRSRLLEPSETTE
ncbi:MAG: hypothetical protein M3285_13440 [Actinomycetota bacterium]|nr:hypothetical protein [Actinomycetota bacterium]MDQ3956542.1 hypothetical protein [Actinomycetota bacterium]